MIRWKSWCRREPAEREVARFGMGRLVRCGTNRYELRGGDGRDLAEAREWAAHFLHAAFIEHPSPPVGPGTRSSEGMPSKETPQGRSLQAIRSHHTGAPGNHSSCASPVQRIGDGRAR